VRTLDTNFVVRLLIGDDPQQTPIAERAFLDAIASGGVYLPDVVLAEVARVLRGYDLLERLVRTRAVIVDEIDAVIDALEHFRQRGDLADQLILARADALPVLSFGQRFSRWEGVEWMTSRRFLVSCGLFLG
jgi:predicted nucleic-acid-binding protein